ncbi:Kazal-type serine protease inhibitor domain [Popillia japonica]|uniref:Kazal-type serine protease inhibitor domain n=1 Tax=Popillia japonica TaxID=7064 RepID=A0AAW1K0F0_POPJA
MKSEWIFVLGVLVLAVACDPTKAAASRQRRQDDWIWGEDPVSSAPSSTTQSPTPSTPPSQPNQDQINQCIKACPATSEFNPICASNNRTYTNEGKFNCAKNCGAGDIEIKFLGSCNQ